MRLRYVELSACLFWSFDWWLPFSYFSSSFVLRMFTWGQTTACKHRQSTWHVAASTNPTMELIRKTKGKTLKLMYFRPIAVTITLRPCWTTAGTAPWWLCSMKWSEERCVPLRHRGSLKICSCSWQATTEVCRHCFTAAVTSKLASYNALLPLPKCYSMGQLWHHSFRVLTTLSEEAKAPTYR